MVIAVDPHQTSSAVGGKRPDSKRAVRDSSRRKAEEKDPKLVARESYSDKLVVIDLQTGQSTVMTADAVLERIPNVWLLFQNSSFTYQSRIVDIPLTHTVRRNEEHSNRSEVTILNGTVALLSLNATHTHDTPHLLLTITANASHKASAATASAAAASVAAASAAAVVLHPRLLPVNCSLILRCRFIVSIGLIIPEQ